MGKDKRSKDKKSHKNKNKHSHKERSHSEGSTRIYLSLRRNTDEVKNKSKSAQTIEEERNDTEVQEVDVGAVNSSDQQDTGLDLDEQDLETEDAVNTQANSSRTDKMILKLKFNPESLSSSKKHKHKRKHKEQEESSYHSHKITGKRAERDSSEELGEKGADQYDTSDRHSHTRKKSKRHNSDIVTEDEEVNRNTQTHSDSAKPQTLDKAEEKLSNQIQPVVTKTEHSLVSEAFEKPSYTDSKVPKSDVQSIRDDALVVIVPPPNIPEISNPESTIKSGSENGNINHVNTSEETTPSFQSTGKKGPARRLGRPPKSQGVQQKSTKRTWTWQKKKKDLRTILSKLLDSFNKKDAYGFFSEPVDTTIVTDYLTIIQNPMDFGTMRKKIDCNEYTSIDEFKEDFSLVCNNCKTYNAPDTIYYKSADKLWQFGEKAIERERDSILLEEEKQKESEAAESGNQGRAGGKKVANGNAMYGSVPNRASSVRQPRRSKKVDPRKLFYPDGSVIPFGDPSSMIPRSPSFGETPLLTVISSKAQRPARFEDYGPYATLGIDPPFFTSSDKNFLYSTYSDEKGYAYAKSIKSFVKDMGDEMNQQVDHFLDKLTRGAHSIDQRVARMISTTDHNASFDTSVITQTELGSVNVGQELNRIRKLSEHRRQQSELDMWKKAKIDVDFLISDQEAHTMMQTAGDGQHNFQELFDLNAKDLAELISLKQSGQLKSSKTEKQITEDLNNRLIQLVQLAPESEKISHTISASRSHLINSMPPHQQATSFSSGNFQTPTTSLQQITLPQINPTSHMFPSVDHTDPISALAPSSMLHENNLPSGSFRARTKPCNYNPAGKCANCQTTDTPGWRAGETPDQKLCNACGLYYSKNKSHRPSNLWNTR